MDNRDEIAYDIGDSRYTEIIKKIIEDFDPKRTGKESKVELKIKLSDEYPICQSPRQLLLLELQIVNKQIE